LTLDGQVPTPFSAGLPPALVVEQGTVEDWVIENRAFEHHVFHIHQMHFLVLNTDEALEQHQYMDTITIPFWDGVSAYPSVKLRMDFTGDIEGVFVYHCHILEHEEKGMMAAIQVVPPCTLTKCHGGAHVLSSPLSSFASHSLGYGITTLMVTAFGAVLVAAVITIRKVIAAKSHEDSNFAALNTTERSAASDADNNVEMFGL
jgi:hypothetical protein